MATTTKLTLQEFLALPETEPASEFIHGEVIQKAMPTGAHAIIQRLLSLMFSRFLLDHPVGEAGSEWRCVFGPPGGEQGFVPDFVFIAAGRLPEDEESLNGPFYGPPDLAVEILSPDDRPGRVLDKIMFYLDYGVRLVLLLDPRERSVRVYTPDARPRPKLLASGDTLDGGDVLPGFTVTVDDLFPRRRVPQE
jgi:Uma2 family endonuclease